MVGQIRQSVGSMSSNVRQLTGVWSSIGKQIMAEGVTLTLVKTSDDPIGTACLSWWQGKCKNFPIGLAINVKSERDGN